MKKKAKTPRMHAAGNPVRGGRNLWIRKPMTQVVNNKKAEQRRTWCRKGTDDGAVFYVMAPNLSIRMKYAFSSPAK